MGHLQGFHERYAAKGLQVFVIAMTEELEEARKTTRSKGWTYPIFNGHGSDVGKRYAAG